MPTPGHAERGGSHPRPQVPVRHRRSGGRGATTRHPATCGSAGAHVKKKQFGAHAPRCLMCTPRSAPTLDDPLEAGLQVAILGVHPVALVADGLLGPVDLAAGGLVGFGRAGGVGVTDRHPSESAFLTARGRAHRLSSRFRGETRLGALTSPGSASAHPGFFCCSDKRLRYGERCSGGAAGPSDPVH